MARSATIFACSSCGHESPKWHGRCPGCGEWNTMTEEKRAAAPAGRAAPARSAGRALAPVRLGQVEAPKVERLLTGIGEFDRVLGGGVVPGSLVLIGGAPGIGKSTLTTAALANLAAAGRKVLYVSGEESAAQVKLRAERLGPHALEVPIVADTDLEAVLATLEAERPDVCVVDSVQVLYDPALTGAPGSVSQVREVAGRLMRVAKERGIATLLVGHVTKEGSLAGPRVLEHLVDCVLSFEGERERTYRTLRALKNRFGSTNEVGVFEMHEEGLVEVEDASARFVTEATRAPGSVVLCAMEGSRPLLVEVQALVAPSEIVPPRRVANGVDRNRLALVLAVLARHGGFSLGIGGRVRLGGRRRAGGRAGRRPGDRAGARLGIEGHLGRGGQAARRLRRTGPDRRAAPRGARRPPDGRGAQVRPHACPPSGGRRRDVAAGARAAERQR